MNHKEAAKYHREQADKEVALQGKSGTSANAYASSRARQQQHTEAAHRADSSYASSRGQEVIYTPVGNPVLVDR